MFSVRALTIAVELWGVAFCVIGIICVLLLPRTAWRYRTVFLVAFVTVLVSAGGDAVAGIFRGQEGIVAWLATHVGNFLTFAGGFVVLAVLTSYLNSRVEESGGVAFPRWVRAVHIATAVMSVCALLGVFYTIDADNIYHRSDWYWLGSVYSVGVGLVNILLVSRSRKSLGRTSYACLMFYLLAPIAAMIVQLFVYGFNFVIAAIVLGLVLLFFEMQVHSSYVLAKNAEELERAKTEAAENRLALLVSQIQPHFLFNSLDTIYGLCDENVGKAKQALALFSRYLRTNLASIRRRTPVPISAEMEHVKTYLELERMSDEGRVGYEFDVQDTSFSVPALSVETLVENAVKHGIGAKEGGGTVIIRTRDHPEEHTVAVIDDGVGFDSTEVPQDSQHVGLANTRMRLAAMCNGVLEVHSTRDEGTTVVMHIPKTKDEK